jgi:hypothetical protein
MQVLIENRVEQAFRHLQVVFHRSNTVTDSTA